VFKIVATLRRCVVAALKTGGSRARRKNDVETEGLRYEGIYRGHSKSIGSEAWRCVVVNRRKRTFAVSDGSKARSTNAQGCTFY